jgi:hypothetical protein
MKERGVLAFALALSLIGCAATGRSPEQVVQHPAPAATPIPLPLAGSEPVPGTALVKVREAGVSFIYSTADFGQVTYEREVKQTAQDVGDGVPVGIAPAHYCFNLEDKRPLPAFDKGPRYFYPTYSFICAYSLQDSSVADFAAAYPNLHDAALALRRLLQTRAAVPLKRDIPDVPYNNAGQSIRSRVQYLDFHGCAGLLCLTQYSQEMQPNPVNNEELTCNFQGLTNDGKYYVAARLAITHPALPKGIDFTDDIERDKGELYLRKAEKQLNRWPEESFRPSLKTLKALLSSISIE